MRELTFVVCLCACATPAPKPAPAAPVVSSTSGIHAKTFQKSGDNGVIEIVGGRFVGEDLDDDRAAAREHADVLMAQHCGMKSYTVIAEGEEAADGSGDPCALQWAWRIHYRCGVLRSESDRPLEILE
jgi:hypothetical protein